MRITNKFLFVSLLVQCSLVLQAQRTVIKAGHYFDSRSGKMLDNQLIVIEGSRIKAVGPDLKTERTDKVIDLSTSWVLPGLMDCHVHISTNLNYRANDWNEAYVTESNAFRAIRGTVVAKELLENGFTTIKEIGNDGTYATADVIKALRRGWITGPTIFYAGKIIAPYGGQSSGVNPEHEHFWNFDYIDADSHDEIKKAIRKNIYNGANVIKMVTGDNGIYDEEDIKVAVEEAKKYGIKVTVHVAFNSGATNVINGGAAAIEHGFNLDDAQLQLMKDKGTFLVGTDFSFDNWYAYGMDSAQAKRLEQMIIDRLKRAYRIGTKMAFGTDVVIDLPGMNRVQSNLQVLRSWKAANIPANYILQTMTINAAELLGIEKERGVIAPAYFADIIAVKNNPLENIDAIKQVSFVMKNGRIIKQ